MSENEKKLPLQEITFEHCKRMMEKHAWNNRTLSEDADLILQRMETTATSISALNDQMEEDRKELARIRTKWGDNFDEYTRWQKSRDELYSSAKYRESA